MGCAFSSDDDARDQQHVVIDAFSNPLHQPQLLRMDSDVAGTTAAAATITTAANDERTQPSPAPAAARSSYSSRRAFRASCGSKAVAPLLRGAGGGSRGSSSPHRRHLAETATAAAPPSPAGSPTGSAAASYWGLPGVSPDDGSSRGGMQDSFRKWDRSAAHSSSKRAVSPLWRRETLATPAVAFESAWQPESRSGSVLVAVGQSMTDQPKK
jgi:hypothetical protein